MTYEMLIMQYAKFLYRYNDVVVRLLPRASVSSRGKFRALDNVQCLFHAVSYRSVGFFSFALNVLLLCSRLIINCTLHTCTLAIIKQMYNGVCWNNFRTRLSIRRSVRPECLSAANTQARSQQFFCLKRNL